MKDQARKLVEKIHREAIEATPPYQRQPVEPPTIDYRELPVSKPRQSA